MQIRQLLKCIFYSSKNDPFYFCVYVNKPLFFPLCYGVESYSVTSDCYGHWHASTDTGDSFASHKTSYVPFVNSYDDVLERALFIHLIWIQSEHLTNEIWEFNPT